MKVIVLAILGLINAIWLTFMHYLDVDLCLKGFSCSNVIQSSFGQWFSVPVSIFGAGFFVYFILVKYNESRAKQLGFAFQGLVVFLAFVAVNYFLALQLLILKQFCLFCLVNHILVLAIIVLITYSLYQRLKHQNEKTWFVLNNEWVALGLIIPLLFFSILNLVSPIPRLKAAEMLKPTYIDGKAYTLDVLDHKAKIKVYQHKQTLYQLRKEVVDSIVLELDAKKQGMTFQKYIQYNIWRKVQISQQDVEAHLEKHIKNLPKEMPMTQKRHYARRHIQEQKFEELKQSLLQRLYTRYNVQLSIPKPNPLKVNPNKVQQASVGQEDAVLEVVMFSDFQCPACKVAKETFDHYLKVFPTQLKVIYRHYPFPFHPFAKQAAQHAVCLEDQGLFMPFSKKVYADQKSLTLKKLNTFAKDLGADTALLNKCLKSNKPKKVLDLDKKEAESLGLNSTPFILINGQHFSKIPTQQDIQQLLNTL